MSTPWNLSNCEDEPIRTPGAIQPHGALIAIDLASQRVSHVSENAEAILGLPCGALLGELGPALNGTLPLPFLTDSGTVAEVGRPLYHASWRAPDDGREWDVISHRSASHLFVELEPAGVVTRSFVDQLYHHLQGVLSQVEQAPSLLSMSDIVVHAVKQMTGFDRVMMYRFDAQWNGEVVAEARREDLEPFLNLHYPAADIPRQARELYTTNWLRFIPDRDYAPAALLSLNSNQSADLDLSFAVLRSVSPIHLEYLRNMGVGASMSVSILNGGQLWGLIACHHYSSRFVSYDARKAAELLGHFVSLQLARIERLETGADRAGLRESADRLLQRLQVSEDFFGGLLQVQPAALEFVPCGGVALICDDEIQRVGHTPNVSDIAWLSHWIANQECDVFDTDTLSSITGSHLWDAIAAGMLAVRIGRRRRLQILWFRPEQSRTIDWAGDPRKANHTGSTPERLSPRGSFALWREEVRGRSIGWTQHELDAARYFHDEAIRLMLARAEVEFEQNQEFRLASKEREQALQQERTARAELEELHRLKDDFVATLSHELRTPLNAILGWSQLLQMQSPDESGDLRDGLALIEQNARAQAKMIEDLLDVNRIIGGKIRLELADVDFARVVEESVNTLSVTAAAKSIRIERAIDSLLNVCVIGDAHRLQQIVWNLLANAIKFTPKQGRINVSVRRIDSHIELAVADSGIGIKKDLLPFIFDRYRQGDASSTREHGGLGLGLAIVRHLVELHGGIVSAESPGEGRGATFVVSLPVRPLSSGSQRMSPTESLPDPSTFSLTELKILVIDDELASRELVRKGLEAHGAAVICCANAGDALESLRSGTFNAVISDIGMPHTDGHALMRGWRREEPPEKRIPAIALTAYVRADDRRMSILSGFDAHLSKPVDIVELVTIVAGVVRRIKY